MFHSFLERFQLRFEFLLHVFQLFVRHVDSSSKYSLVLYILPLSEKSNLRKHSSKINEEVHEANEKLIQAIADQFIGQATQAERLPSRVHCRTSVQDIDQRQ